VSTNEQIWKGKTEPNLKKKNPKVLFAIFHPTLVSMLKAASVSLIKDKEH
jgi:hypothetical protein